MSPVDAPSLPPQEVRGLPRSPADGRWTAAWIAWLCLLAGGFAYLGRYSATSGERGPIARQWPAASTLALDPERPNLLVFAHPRCPCTRASIEMLAQELGRWPLAPRTRVIFFAPAELEPERARAWAQTDLWRRASTLPGVTAELDPGGLEARAFGARTSGEALLFGPKGELRFAGGLTPARGHRGPSIGAALLRTSLQEAGAKPNFAPVFGCSLLGDESPPIGPTGPAQP